MFSDKPRWPATDGSAQHSDGRLPSRQCQPEAANTSLAIVFPVETAQRSKIDAEWATRDLKMPPCLYSSSTCAFRQNLRIIHAHVRISRYSKRHFFVGRSDMTLRGCCMATYADLTPFAFALPREICVRMCSETEVIWLLLVVATLLLKVKTKLSL